MYKILLTNIIHNQNCLNCNYFDDIIIKCKQYGYIFDL
jgi:hypothetical protein